jgi:hypothetical protein
LAPYAAIRISCAKHAPIKNAGNRIKIGMTRENVQMIYGPPHSRYIDHERREIWFYYCDCLGWWAVGVRFDEGGQVENTWW